MSAGNNNNAEVRRKSSWVRCHNSGLNELHLASAKLPWPRGAQRNRQRGFLIVREGAGAGAGHGVNGAEGGEGLDAVTKRNDFSCVLRRKHNRRI
jgi:hypothetical protein